jgi:hypothetical protein
MDSLEAIYGSGQIKTYVWENHPNNILESIDYHANPCSGRIAGACALGHGDKP